MCEREGEERRWSKDRRENRSPHTTVALVTHRKCTHDCWFQVKKTKGHGMGQQDVCDCINDGLPVSDKRLSTSQFSTIVNALKPSRIKKKMVVDKSLRAAVTAWANTVNDSSSSSNSSSNSNSSSSSSSSSNSSSSSSSNNSSSSSSRTGTLMDMT
jgi:hypothetical protein